ncbi:hypothetical protein BC834DRAFT_823062 [Gloeopeniophorella convolvens]|nr:hypothetical protein BC834DRAFT_823062 [Gloeopeniophorella convolvens]
MSRSSPSHLPSFGPPPSASAISAGLADLLHPRKSRQRATILCLLSLVAVTAYVCLVSQPALAPALSSHHGTPAGAEDAWLKWAARFPAAHPAPKPRPEITLSPEEELGAVTAFMAALPQNIIPPGIDATRPIDPQLVLDFDTRSQRAEAEVAEVVSDVWFRNPVVVFSKLYSPASRELKSTLDAMELRPAPTVFDVDDRADADVLIPLLYRLTNTTELPILLIGGTPIGSMDAIRELDASGQLKALVTRAGAVLDGSKRRRKGRR